MSAPQRLLLLISILIVALCGIAYELIIGTISSYLLGNSVYQFSFTIGFFMFSMGVGSYLSKLLDDQHIRNFIGVEIAISLVGGVCSLLLFMAFPLVRALYDTTMYSLILIIGALVGMEIPILTTILSKKNSTRDSIANVMSLDYLGALIGSVAFPLLLLPQLGLIRSSFAIALINILTALVNIYFFRHHLPHPKRLAFISISILIMLIAFTITGTRLTSFAEKHLYFDQVIYSKQTPYQHIVVTRSNNNRENRLYIDGHIQFSSKDEYRYHESLVHPVMNQPGPKKNILILGGGDGLAAREILKYPEVEAIHLVDIDPEMTAISREFPTLAILNQRSLEHEKLTIFHQDAFTFINRPGMLYDKVIIDMPDPHNEAINKLYSREFYTMIRKRMAETASIVTQSSSPFFTRQTYWCIAETMEFVFGETANYHTTVPAFGLWGFNLASKQGNIQPFQPIEVDTRYLSDQQFNTSRIFGKDTERLATNVNSIMEPTLYQYYIDDLQQ
ncbi:hypothetical protein A9Q99_18450 [Gammaproteobacteria bacterium 45_16_T64]|nr:hypothetical protein A9Q99_18450 [Gammaproteobacteria bacterium 45_16_T64]